MPFRERKYPAIQQLDSMDCGPTCLQMVAKFYGKDVPIDKIRESSSISREGVSLNGLSEAATEIGFNSVPVELTLEELKEKAPLPLIVYWEESHFVVVYEIKKDTITIADPRTGLVKLSTSDFHESWSKGDEIGFALLLERNTSFFEESEISNKRKGLGFLLPYFLPYKKQLIQIGIGLIFASLLQLILPFMTQALVDYGVNLGDLNFVYLILIAQIVVFVSRSSVEYIRGWILLYVTGKMNISLLSDFLGKLMGLPLAYFETRHSSDIVQRILDNKKIEEFLSSYTLTTLFSAFTIIIFSLILLYYSPYIFLVFLLGSALYFMWSISFLKKRKIVDAQEFKEATDNQQSIYQLISGMHEIKLNGSQTKRKWEWENIQGRLFKVSEKGLRIDQKQHFGAIFINELTNIFITFISASLVINGQITLGAMLSIQYIIGQLNLPLGNLISFLRISQDAKLSLDRLREIHEQDDEQTDESVLDISGSGADIKFENLNFRYGSKKAPLVLDNINLTVEKGKVTAIVGNSGSGKTTLLKLLMKYYDNYNGSITVNGTDLREMDTKKWRELCGTVMQDGYLFNDTVESNICESGSVSSPDKTKLQESIRIANLEEAIKRMPKGIKTSIGPDGSSLSGGENQRLMIARMVYKNPKFIMLDEATASLDATNEREIMHNLNAFFKSRTTIVIAHRLSTVKNADKIVVLNKGRVVETGKHDALIKKKGEYYNLVKNQLEISK